MLRLSDVKTERNTVKIIELSRALEQSEKTLQTQTKTTQEGLSQMRKNLDEKNQKVSALSQALEESKRSLNALIQEGFSKSTSEFQRINETLEKTLVKQGQVIGQKTESLEQRLTEEIKRLNDILQSQS